MENINEQTILERLNHINDEYFPGDYVLGNIDSDEKQLELERLYTHAAGAVSNLIKDIEASFREQAESYEEEQKVGVNRTGDE